MRRALMREWLYGTAYADPADPAEPAAGQRVAHSGASQELLL